MGAPFFAPLERWGFSPNSGPSTAFQITASPPRCIACRFTLCRDWLTCKTSLSAHLRVRCEFSPPLPAPSLKSPESTVLGPTVPRLHTRPVDFSTRRVLPSAVTNDNKIKLQSLTGFRLRRTPHRITNHHSNVRPNAISQATNPSSLITRHLSPITAFLIGISPIRNRHNSHRISYFQISNRRRSSLFRARFRPPISKIHPARQRTFSFRGIIGLLCLP